MENTDPDKSVLSVILLLVFGIVSAAAPFCITLACLKYLLSN